MAVKTRIDRDSFPVLGTLSVKQLRQLVELFNLIEAEHIDALMRQTDPNLLYRSQGSARALKDLAISFEVLSNQ